jgi:hypothetical protein
MEYVHCEVSDGPRDGFKSVAVGSVEGYCEYLVIEERFLSCVGADWFMPVSVIGKDTEQKTTLIELPVEADSGAKRVWVHGEAIFDKPRAIA